MSSNTMSAMAPSIAVKFRFRGIADCFIVPPAALRCESRPVPVRASRAQLGPVAGSAALAAQIRLQLRNIRGGRDIPGAGPARIVDCARKMGALLAVSDVRLLRGAHQDALLLGTRVF